MGENINLCRIQYNNNRPFLEHYVPSIDKWKREYGEIRKCIRCGSPFFYQSSRKRPGQHCSTHCNQMDISKKEFENIKTVPYSGSVNWSYVAGFFDGEGNITKHYGSWWELTIAQKYGKALYDTKDFLLSQGVKSTIHYGCNQMGYLKLGNIYNVFAFLQGILPFSIVKRSESLLAESEILDIICVE